MAGMIGGPLSSSSYAGNPVDLDPIPTSNNTGEKPQSKVWKYNNTWWACISGDTPGGTRVWRLDGTSWTDVLQISSSTGTFADCRQRGNLVHILLFDGFDDVDGDGEFITLQHVAAGNTYEPWSENPNPTFIDLSPGVETATIDVDSTGHVFLAADAVNDVEVYHAAAPAGGRAIRFQKRERRRR